MAKPYDFSTALMVPRDPQLSPKAQARAEQAAIEKRRRELMDEYDTWRARKEEQYQNNQRREAYRAIDKMQFPKANPIQYKDTVPTVELSQAPLQGPTETAVGGPEGKPAPWANDPVVDDGPQASAKPWENDPVVDDAPAQQAQPLKRSELDAGIEEAVASAGGMGSYYKQPADPERMKALGYVRDPLAPAGYAKPAGPDPFTSMGNSPAKAWNENVADILQAGADFLLAPLEARDTGGDDLLGAAAKGVARGTADAPAMAFRDPAQFVDTYDPAHQILRGYNSAVDLGGDLIEGDVSNVIPKASSAVTDTLSGVMGITGLGGVIKPKPGTAAAAKQASVRQPSVRETGKTLAASILPTSAIRPQAYDAIERILVNSGVPRDRVRLGLAKVVEGLKTGADGAGVGASGRQTIAQLLEREYGKEFPEVIENLRTVLLERRLSRKAGDRSPTTVRETVQDMRGTQVPHLQESLNKNFGDATRTGTREQVAENLRQIGQEGYQPIVSQTATPERAQAIQSVLNGPGMSELTRPLRQIAAGEGVDIETMIKQVPIEAAHWMQHKARLLAEENGDTALGNAYNSMRNRILKTIDDLTAPDGRTYAQIRKEYGDEAGIKTALTAGDRFGAIVRNPDGANQFIAKFNEATPEQQAAQLSSIRDWAASKLRGGGEEGAARMTELQNIAVLDTLDRLGPQGKALADDIRAIREEEKFLSGFYPKSESATASNIVAREQGPDIYSRAAKSSIGMSTATDGILMGAGATHAPLITALRQGPKLYRGMMQPKTATREDMTRILMARPGQRPVGSGSSPAPAPAPPSRSIPPSSTPSLRQRLMAGTSETQTVQQLGKDAFEWQGPTPQKPQSLVAWLKQQGGIDDSRYMTGDLKAIMGRHNGMPGLLNRKSGTGLDDLVSAAYHQGFDVDPNDANSLLRLIEEEFSGNPSYRLGAREEWDVYQEYLAAKNGDTPPPPPVSSAPPPPSRSIPPKAEATLQGGADTVAKNNPQSNAFPGSNAVVPAASGAGGAAYGWANPIDANEDGVIDDKDRMITATTLGLGALTLTGVGRTKGRNPNRSQLNTFGGGNMFKKRTQADFATPKDAAAEYSKISKQLDDKRGELLKTTHQRAQEYVKKYYDQLEVDYKRKSDEIEAKMPQWRKEFSENNSDRYDEDVLTDRADDYAYAMYRREDAKLDKWRDRQEEVIDNKASKLEDRLDAQLDKWHDEQFELLDDAFSDVEFE